MTTPVGLCECGCGSRTKIATRNRTRTGQVKGQPFRFVRGHGNRGFKVALEVRFWSQVNKNGPISPYCPELGPCWVWEGRRDVDKGYGRFYIGRRDGEYIGELAHRYAWELEHGPIPAGKQIMHICNFPPCVRHLTLGTQADNMQWMSECGRDSKYWLGKTFSPAHLANLGLKGEANPAYRHDLPDATVLAEMYRKAGSVTAVARMLRCSHRAVARRLKTVGVKLRTLSEIASERTGNKNSFFGRRHTPASLRKMSKSHQRRCQD